MVEELGVGLDHQLQAWLLHRLDEGHVAGNLLEAELGIAAALGGDDCQDSEEEGEAYLREGDDQAVHGPVFEQLSLDDQHHEEEDEQEQGGHDGLHHPLDRRADQPRLAETVGQEERHSKGEEADEEEQDQLPLPSKDRGGDRQQDCTRCPVEQGEGPFALGGGIGEASLSLVVVLHHPLDLGHG